MRIIGVTGPMNSGTNLVTKILNECIDNITNKKIDLHYEVPNKHSIKIEDIQKYLSNKDNLLIIMYKNVFNWIYSMKKTCYNVKFTQLNDKIDLNNSVELWGDTFVNIIDLYNHYYKMYIKILQENDNVIFLDYYKVIQKNSMFNYINQKISRLNISLKSEINVKKILDSPSKCHGNNVKNSEDALNSYFINYNNIKSYVIENTNIYNFVNNETINLFESDK